jgi:4-amino-4-deoxy-L-arabinose transferase-like glycosyltransferase
VTSNGGSGAGPSAQHVGTGLRRAPRATQAGVASTVVFRRWLAAILLVAVILRAGLLFYAEAHPEPFDFPDSHRYVRVARNIAAGLGPIESDTVRAGTDPLYPLILSLGIRLGAEDAVAVMRVGRIANALAAVTSILILAALTRRLVGDSAALIAAACLAVDPILLFFNALVLTETCYIALLLAGFYAVLRMGEARPLGHIGWEPARRDRPVPRTTSSSPFLWACLAGACIGLGTMMRSTNLFMPLALMPFVWLFALRNETGSARRRIGVAACFLLMAIVALVPSAVRNYRLFGQLTFTRSGGGASLMEALGPWADGGPGMEKIVYPPFPDGADELTRDRLCRAAAIDWAKSHPWAVARLAWIKLLRTWSITLHATGYSSILYRVICWLSVAPVFVMALVGVWRLRRKPALVGLLLLPAVYFTLIHLVFVGSVRYRLPAVPFLFVLAAAGICLCLNPENRHRAESGRRQAG